jgi:hypothetical protein
VKYRRTPREKKNLKTAQAVKGAGSFWDLLKQQQHRQLLGLLELSLDFGVTEDGITENAITFFFAEPENGITRKRSNLKIQ